MPRVHHVKKAAKDNQVVKKGEPYYWWKFRHSGKRYSKTYPRPSQLTQSEFLSQAYELAERLEDLEEECQTVEDLKSEVEGIADEIESLGSEQEEKIYNMPDALQESETAELLRGRSETCSEWADNLRGIDMDTMEEVSGDEPEDDESDREEPSEGEQIPDEPEEPYTGHDGHRGEDASDDSDGEPEPDEDDDEDDEVELNPSEQATFERIMEEIQNYANYEGE